MTVNPIEETSTEALIALRDAASTAYYADGTSSLSDAEFDDLAATLAQRGVEEPVGGGFIPADRKVSRDIPMLSLDKVRTVEEIAAFLERTGNVPVLVQHKYDGLAVEVIYGDDGNIEQAATRGSGYVGEDVTAAVQAMAATGRVPAHIDTSLAPLTVRGEILMTVEDFADMNARLEEGGQAPLIAQRNAATGLLKRHDVADAGLYLSLKVFDFPDEVTEQDLVRLGFDVAHQDLVPADIDAISAIINRVGEERASLPYEIDGIVLKVADLGARQDIGANSHHPLWAVAFKYPNVYQQTILRNVFWETRRTGRVVPVAQFDQLIFGNARVTNATLNNAQFLKALKLRIGDTLDVTRSNDVIPYIKGRHGAHAADAVKIKYPTRCPNCKRDLVRVGVDLKCPQNGACDYIGRVVYSLSALGVLGVSGALVGALRRDGARVRDVIDLLRVRSDQIAKLDGFGQVSAQKAVDAMSVVWDAPLSSWITAVGVPLVGHRLGSILQHHYDSLHALGQATYEELIAIDGIGDGKARAIIGGSAAYLKWAHRLEKHFGFTPRPAEVFQPSVTDSPLSGKRVVITGTLPTLKRNDAFALAAEHGAELQGAVSSKTDLLIAGEKAGSKLAKAESLGVPVMTGEEFEALVVGQQ